MPSTFCPDTEGSGEQILSAFLLSASQVLSNIMSLKKATLSVLKMGLDLLVVVQNRKKHRWKRPAVQLFLEAAARGRQKGHCSRFQISADLDRRGAWEGFKPENMEPIAFVACRKFTFDFSPD